MLWGEHPIDGAEYKPEESAMSRKDIVSAAYLLPVMDQAPASVGKHKLTERGRGWKVMAEHGIRLRGHAYAESA